MVGDRGKVHRARNFDDFTGLNGRRLAFSEPVGRIEILPVTKEVSVGREIGVNVEVPEVDVVKWACRLN